MADTPLTLFETKNYIVVCGTYPSGEFEGQGCYLVRNKITKIDEIFVNLLPKAIYLAREAQELLDDVYADATVRPNQLLLMN
jgi:hypothetical protein